MSDTDPQGDLWRRRPQVAFVSASDRQGQKWINLSQLLSTYDEAKRRRLWSRIKQRSPELAALLQDKALWELARTFSAQVYVEDRRETTSAA